MFGKKKIKPVEITVDLEAANAELDSRMNKIESNWRDRLEQKGIDPATVPGDAVPGGIPDFVPPTREEIE